MLVASIVLLASPAASATVTAQSEQSATPARPTGIADDTDSGDDDLITKHTSVDITGAAASGATVRLTASATRDSTVYTATTTVRDISGGSYTATLDLSTSTTGEGASIPHSGIDGSWSITARQTETGKSESGPSQPLNIIIDTLDPTFALWVGYPDSQDSGNASREGAVSSSVTGLASHNGILYVVDDSAKSLKTLDLDTDTTESVGSFRTVEQAPTGLASHDGVLYMIGGDHDALYTLDIATGAATRVGSFGATENTPTGLASHGGLLYMVGSGNSALYTIDPTTGAATRVGSLGTEQTPTGLASHGGLLYMVGSGNSALYTIDPTTGAATRVNSNAEQFNVSEGAPSGLTSHDGKLYMAGANNSALYAVSTGGVIPKPINGAIYLKSAVFVRVTGVNDPGQASATRTIFGDTNTRSGEASFFTFENYSHEGDDGAGVVSVTVTDAAGNSASSTQNIVIDTSRPTLAIDDVPAVTNGAFTATFTFGESVTGFDLDDIALENGTASDFNAANAPNYTALITPLAEGEVRITVAAREFTDRAGNTGPRRQVSRTTRYDPSHTPTAVTVSFAQATYQASEDVMGGTLSVSVILSQTPGRRVVAPIAVQTDSTATGGSDYTLPNPSSVTFAAAAADGGLSQAYVVTLVDDSASESDETLVLGFGNLPSGVTAGTQATTTIEIVDDDTATLSFSIDPTTVSESANSTTTVTAALTGATLLEGLTLPLTFTGSATRGTDYTVSSASITIAAGESSGTAQLTVTDDRIDENDETATVGTSHADYSSAQTATLTIQDDDTRGIVVSPASDRNVPEGGTYEYMVRLGSQPTGRVTVTAASNNTDVTLTSAGDATQGSSVQLTFMTTNWDANQTVTMTAAVDADGDNESMTVSHTAAGSDYQGLARLDEAFTVNDNNVAPKFSETGYTFTLAENENGATTSITVGTPISATDSDAGDTVSYAITAGNTGNKFAIGASSGQITYTGSGEDFEATTTSFTLTVTATGGAGSRAQSVTAMASITVTDVDDTPPKVTSTTFNTDGNQGYAKEGDTITVTFKVDEALSAKPAAAIAGQTATVDGSGTNWTASYTVEAGVNAVNASFDLGVITDGAGNAVDQAAVDTNITIDTTAPSITEATAVAATTDTSPTYVFRSDEAGTVTYTGACGNGSVSSVQANTDAATTFSGLRARLYNDCVVIVTDAAGNAGMLAVTSFVVQMEQSATPAQPTGISDDTDSGGDDLITKHTSIAITGTASNSAVVRLTASSTRGVTAYAVAATTTADHVNGAYTVALDLSAAATSQGSAIPDSDIDGAWVILARQTDTGKSESAPSPPLTITIDTQAPTFTLWVGYPDSQEPGTVRRVTSISSGVTGMASQDGVLYVVYDDTDALHAFDLSTGTTTRVASFGTAEQSPAGLASHNGLLYMVGADNDALYTLDTTNGAATRIGSFGTMEQTPAGLASHNGLLYMVGDGDDALYTLDTANGAATRVGSLGTEQTPAGLASHNGLLYMVGSGNSTLYTLDTRTGAATRVNDSVEQFGVSEESPSALTSHDGLLYVVGADNSVLYAVSTGGVIPEVIDGAVYLPRSAVFVRVTGVNDPGSASATRTVFGDTNTQSGESTFFTFENYTHEGEDGPGTVSVNVTDAAGNSATTTQRIVIDTAMPRLTISGVPGVTSEAFTATFTFDEVVAGFNLDDIMVDNGAASAFDSTNALTYTALITPIAEGTVTVTVAARVVTDRAGNAGPTPQASRTTHYDTIAPSVRSAPVSATDGNQGYAKEADTITVTFDVSEALRTTPTATIAGRMANVNGSGTSWTVTYVVEAGVNAANAAFDLGDITDATGNASDPAAVDTNITVDTTAPTVSYAAPTSLRVGVEISGIVPSDASPTDNDFSSHVYAVKSGSTLPQGLSLDGATGHVTGAPTAASTQTQSTTIVITDAAGNIQEAVIDFRVVEKGIQPLAGFAYAPSIVTFGGAAPKVVEPTGAQGTISYESRTTSVCTVGSTDGALTILSNGACAITATAGGTDDYLEATAQASVTVNPEGTLSLTLDVIAGDGTVNATEKAAGFAVTGHAGTEVGVDVTVTIGEAALTADSDTEGAWVVHVPADAAYLVEPSVEARVTATKAGLTGASPVVAAITVDTTAPTVSYATPPALRVGVTIKPVSPSDTAPPDDGFASYTYEIGPGSTLPLGLSLDDTFGRITGAPTTASTRTHTTAVVVTDTAGNGQEALIVFPVVAKGVQILTGFAYNPSSITFGATPPEVVPPTRAPGATLSYRSDTPSVCSVSSLTGTLTIIGVGTCTITVTAAGTDDHLEAMARTSVTVNTAGTLSLSVDTIAGNDAVNAGEKAAGFAVTGRTGRETGVNVSVSISTALLTTVSDSGGIWSVSVPPNSSYIAEPSVRVLVTAAKAGLTDAAPVTRTMVVDVTAPMVSVVNPDQPVPARARIFSAKDDDAGYTTWQYGVQVENNCATEPPIDAAIYTEGSSVTLGSEAYNAKHVCFWSTDAAGNTSSGVSDRIAGIDTTAPWVSYDAPVSLTVGVEIAPITPTHVSPADDVASYTHAVGTSSALPQGLSLNGTTGRIVGAPTSASAAAQTTIIVVTDTAGNRRDVSIDFPEVAKGTQTITGFAYDSSATSGGAPPSLIAPTGTRGPLSYRSLTPLVCTVHASTGALTIVSDGTCTITVTAEATDDYEASTALQASVRVSPAPSPPPPVPPPFILPPPTPTPSPNRAPEVTGTIAHQTLTVGGDPATVNVSSSFIDHDGDRLIYVAESNDDAVARVSVSGSVVSIRPATAGLATVTVTARDPGGLTAAQAFSVTVTETNRVPEAAGTIAPLTLTAGGDPATLDVSSYFRDPDGHGLTYTAASDDDAAAVSVSGSVVSIRPAAAGLATVTVTARDPGGLTATQAFSVIVTDANRAPEAAGTIANRALTAGGDPATLDMSSYFRDPDGDRLTYTAASDDDAAAVSVSGSVVSIRPASAGRATVTVTARDPGGLTATQAFSVTVTDANRAPEAAGTIANRALTAGGDPATLDVSNSFIDPDGHGLTYTVASDDDAAAVSVSGSVVSIRPSSAGRATVTVTARDPGGLTATQAFSVTVTDANRAPEAAGTIANRALTAGGGPATLDVSNSFIDPDGHRLTYTAASDDDAAAVSVSGSVVSIRPASAGRATVTVTARDPGGLTAAQAFSVIVNDGLAQPSAPPTPTPPPSSRATAAAATIDDQSPGTGNRAAAVVFASSNMAVAEVDGHVDSSGAVTVSIMPKSSGTSTITVTASVSDGAVTTSVEVDAGEGIPLGTRITLPDSLSRSGGVVTASFHVSSLDVEPPSGFRVIGNPTAVDITLSVIPSEPVTVCLPVDPEAGGRAPALLHYDEDAEAWEEVTRRSRVETLVDGTRLVCADTMDFSSFASAYELRRDAALTSLVVAGLRLRPSFDPNVTNYEAAAASVSREVTISAAARDSEWAGVAISPADSVMSMRGHQVPLQVGRNVVRVTVTAEDISVTSSYVVVVTRMHSLPPAREATPILGPTATPAPAQSEETGRTFSVRSLIVALSLGIVLLVIVSANVLRVRR